MRYEQINNELFKQNRQNFAKHLKPNSIAVFTSNDQMPKSADATYPWRQNPDLFYLTGIDQEDTYLILFPDAYLPEQREILFTRKTNDVIAVWEGKKHSIEEAKTFSGIDSVKWADGFYQVLNSLMLQATHCYLNLNEHSRSSNSLDYGELRLARELKQRFPLHNYERSAPILHDLRAHKSSIEVALTNRAIDITEKGFRRVLQFVKPNVWEYEVEAEITHEFLRNRATGHAYTPIIANGENACVLHYVSNNDQCKDGDLLLMDFGAEYGNYNADLTRTIPVNGRFTERQKTIYSSVLKIMKQARSMMRPGIVLFDFNKEVGGLMEAELIAIGLLDKDAVAKQDKDNPLYKKYFPHGTAHFLGLDVHDSGNYYKKLEAGTILTCEPGIYIKEERIGIRIENNILITNDEPIDLMKNIPVEMEEIEDLMNAKK